MCVDPGTENTHFKSLPSVISVNEIPGPIHVDKADPSKHTQTVEGSHSGVKMRLRLGRGLPRHNLQSVMDLEDFIYNRTDGSAQDVFKKIGDIAAIYSRTVDTKTKRHSNLGLRLRDDIPGCPIGLTLPIVTSVCSSSVFLKASRFEVKSSSVISTQCFPTRNTIIGEFRGARIHDHMITWTFEHIEEASVQGNAFNISNLAATCTCKYHKKEKPRAGTLCSHIVGQLRRTIFLGQGRYSPLHIGVHESSILEDEKKDR